MHLNASIRMHDVVFTSKSAADYKDSELIRDFDAPSTIATNKTQCVHHVLVLVRYAGQYLIF